MCLMGLSDQTEILQVILLQKGGHAYLALLAALPIVLTRLVACKVTRAHCIRLKPTFAPTGWLSEMPSNRC